MFIWKLYIFKLVLNSRPVPELAFFSLYLTILILGISRKTAMGDELQSVYSCISLMLCEVVMSLYEITFHLCHPSSNDGMAINKTL